MSREAAALFATTLGLLSLECSSDSRSSGSFGTDETDPLTGGPTLNLTPDGGDSMSLGSDIENFDGTPVDASAGFAECVGINQQAENASRPVDIIFVIDNSSSMNGEIRQVQARINEDFADIIEQSGVDYRVIMISRYGDLDVQVGDSDNPICIGGRLGGTDCGDPDNTPLAHNEPRFYHYSTDVRSREPWCRMLEGWDTPDELTTDNDRPNWNSIAPDGWSAFLRDGTFKSFVVIADDDSHCGPDVESNDRAPFRDVAGQPFRYNFDDGNTAAEGTRAAADFDAALLALSPHHFGTAARRNYNFYSIVGLPDNSPPEAPWTPDQPIQEGTCPDGSEGPATGFQALSVLTGGLRYPSCRNDNFNAMFQSMATGVIQGALSCEWTIPPPPQGSSLDHGKVNLVYTPPEGNRKLGSFVASAADCELGGWYFDDPGNPSAVVACPTTCDVLRADPKARVSVLFGCDRVDIPIK